MDSRSRLLGMDLLLLLVTFFWGTTFIIVKNAVAQVDVFAFLSVRFSSAFLIMLAVFHKRIRPLSMPTVRAGGILGIFLFAAFSFQTWGLIYTSATNGAFLTGLNVVIVPVLMFIFLKRAPAPFAVAGILTAFAGLYYLAGGTPANWNRGDILEFVCAFWIAVHILLTGYYAPKLDTLALAIWQVGAVALLSLVFALATGSLTLDLPLSVWGAVAITSLLCTVFAYLIQTHAQRYIPPARTALNFTAEPVLGVLFAHWYGGEVLMMRHLIGGGFIFLGMILAEIRPGLWSRINGSGEKSVAAE